MRSGGAAAVLSCASAADAETSNAAHRTSATRYRAEFMGTRRAKLTPAKRSAARYTGSMNERPPRDDPPPVAPIRPDNDECCGGGCNPCIFDLYEEARERYEEALAAWHERNRDRSTPREPAG
ncbi:MAG TPA: oxidoreductase-like domain-containing protein [Casimicrobiaceae bacterium]|nr:oxidoreductase-like domain-containing protein [Casimicrobiaceae bacterium]